MLPQRSRIGLAILGLFLLCSASSFVTAEQETPPIISKDEPATNYSCLRCNSSNGVDCEEPKVGTCVGADKQALQCYVQFDAESKDVVGMGCRNEFENERNLVELIKSKLLYLCTGRNCNDFARFPTSNYCQRCSSEAEEVCATKPSSLVHAVTCAALPYTQCYQRINPNGNGATERGCLHDLEADEFYRCLTGADALCKICTGRNCNEEIIPIERLQCHRCNSLNDSSCHLNPSALSACPTYKKDDACVSFFEKGVTRRACLSELACDASSPKCHICQGKGCNIKTPETAQRFSCNHCRDDNCDEPVTKECVNIVAGDQCYIQFDNSTHSAIRMGCKSELSSSELLTGIKDYYLCDEANCNTYENLSPALFCKVCNSTTDENCVVNPNLMEDKYCRHYPYTDCYSHVDSDGTTHRGCLLDLPAEKFLECRSGNSSHCQICSSSRCNDGIFPRDRLECYRCNSLSSENCETEPSVRQVCPIYNPNDACVTKIEDGVTYRGCRSDFKCPVGANRRTCQTCTGSLCNTVDLMAQYVGDPGKFQALPLSCHHCNGTDECSASLRRIEKCSGLDEKQTCITAFSEDGRVVARGCRDDIDEVCTSPGIECQECKSNSCNTARQRSDYIDCLFCDAKRNAVCSHDATAVSRIRKCHKSCATVLYQRNSDPSPVYELTRTCLDDLDLDDREKCISGADAKCKACHKDKCNVDSLGKRKSCYQCSGISNCKSASVAQTCRAFTENEQCFARFQGAPPYMVLELGCASQYDSPELTEMLKNKTLVLCEGENCNELKNQTRRQECTICSSKTDALCATLPANVSSNTDCRSKPSNKCYTRILSNGHTERGCLSSLEGEEYFNCLQNSNSSACLTCQGDFCNNELYPKDRLSCHICNSNSSDSCEINPQQPQVCQKHLTNQLCVSKLTTDGTTVRGCSAEVSCDDSVNCVKCDSANCNTDVFTNKTLSCLSCVGESCEDLVATQCRKHDENDQCYLLFNDDSDVTQMGCLSDLDDVFVQNNRHLLVLCREGDNCNTFDKIPRPRMCALCNSAEDPQCASDPKAVATGTQCRTIPNTQCVTYVSVAGITFRGCLSSLEKPQMLSCLEGHSEYCTACAADRCNIEVFPSNRRSCHRCNTVQDPTCKSAPNAAAICPHYSSSEFCTVKLVNNHTYRGCSSDFQCDETDKRFCRHCYGADNCNTMNLDDTSVGPPGRWQSLPLNCHTCTGESCSSGRGPLRVCAGDKWQTCVSVFDASSNVTARGCSEAVAAVHGDYCNKHPDKCIHCKSNGCNFANKLDQFTDCYFCDSETSDTCATNFDNSTRTRKCHDGCMVALYPLSSANNTEYALTRSCLDDKDLDDRVACKSGKDANCRYCEGARCNTMVPATQDRHECFHCEDDCEDPAPRKCKANHANDQCYIHFDAENSVTRMGCRSDRSDEEVTALLKTKKLILCDEKNCNSLDSVATPNTCSVCDSEADPRCATNPNLITDMQNCLSLPYTDCYTRINAAGHTSRGCFSTLEPETFYACLMGNDSLCKTCHGKRCNGIDVFPPQRMKCHQCNSTVEPACGTTAASNKICPIYKQDDACFVRLRNGVTTRGCVSTEACDPHSDPHCRVCNTPGCNRAVVVPPSEHGLPGRWQSLPLSCRHCNGAEDCKKLGIFRVCEKNSLQNCMSVFAANGTVVRRGCSDPVLADNAAYCASNVDLCPRCNSNGCNVATTLTDYVECLTCDSDNHRDCVMAAKNITRTRKCYKRCMTALYARDLEDNPSYALARTCLDDMDLDERTDCEAGRHDFCQACSGPKCNTASVPPKRLSCYHCTGSQCDNPQAQTCTTYRPNDQCYIRYDEQQSAIAMGCRSEFSNRDADKLLAQKRLFLCKDDNCNTAAAVPPAHDCVLCNSRTDVECATQPHAVQSATTCFHVPNTGCYSRVLSDGATERGCISSLHDDEFLSCLNGTSSTCAHCVGDKCNKDVFPSGRLTCHICDSSNDPECEKQPNSLSICHQYLEPETCVTSFVGGVTKRGCGANLACNVSDSQTCVQCSGHGCNTVNLAIQEDDNFGKWQDLPLRCRNCSDSDCRAASTVTTCENNNLQDCMTVFDVNANVVRRGCSDAVKAQYANYCTENKENCFSCKSNECNTAERKSEFLECVYCDSLKNADCVWNPLNSSLSRRMCRSNCMSALYPAYNGSNPAYALIRTCLDDKEVADQTSCLGGNDSTCHACKSANCNVIELAHDRLRCHTCEGEDCEEPQSRQCVNYQSGDKCFTWFDESNSVSQMGCISSLRNHDLESLIATKRVLVCDGHDCNNQSSLPGAQKCASCTSENDPLCATNALQVKTLTSCSRLPHTSCYTMLDRVGRTTRGCLSDLPETSFVSCLLGQSKDCAVCQGDGCNREIFPADRLQCYTCSTEEDPSCESFPKQTLPCSTVGEHVACVTALGRNNTVRGCSTEVFCDSSDRQNCRSCKGTACNSIDLRNKEDDGYHGAWQALPLNCHTCVGDHCRYSLGPLAECSGNDAQDCMTVFGQDGKVRRRGCSDDVEDYEDLYCRSQPQHCFKCKSNACNIAWELEEYIQCTYCNSSTQTACAVQPEHDSLGTRACYKECMVALKEGAVLRSCLDDKELFHQTACRLSESGDNCAACSDGDRCNTFMYPPDRLRCHVCATGDCSQSESQLCEVYEDETDFCFARYTDGRVDLMGCASSQNATTLEAWEAEGRVYKCESADCNALEKLPTPNECLACDSSETPECAQNALLVQASETCMAPRSNCVTQITEAGDTVRGCLRHLTVEQERTCVAAGNCVTCSGLKCNAQIFPADRLVCHICNSESDPFCAAKPANVFACRKYDAHDRCVASLSSDGIVQRGCASEISCAKNETTEICEFCDTAACNFMQLLKDAAAGFLSGSLVVTLLLVLVATAIGNFH